MHKLSLKGLEFYGYHGVLPEEKILGARYYLDIDIFYDFTDLNDDINESINYVDVYERVKIFFEAKFNLIETLTLEIAKMIKETYACRFVRVCLHKPNAPINGTFRDIVAEVTI